MTGRSIWQAVFRFLLTAGTVCVLTQFSIQSAQATCGDYLSHSGPLEEVESPLLHHPKQLPVRLPCSGPQCQQQRRELPPEAPVVMITVFKPACASSEVRIHSRTPREKATLGQPESYSGLYLYRIDRPPQPTGI